MHIACRSCRVPSLCPCHRPYRCIWSCLLYDAGDLLSTTVYDSLGASLQPQRGYHLPDRVQSLPHYVSSVTCLIFSLPHVCFHECCRMLRACRPAPVARLRLSGTSSAPRRARSHGSWQPPTLQGTARWQFVPSPVPSSPVQLFALSAPLSILLLVVVVM